MPAGVVSSEEARDPGTPRPVWILVPWLGIFRPMGKVRVIVKTEGGQHQIYVDRARECTLYAATDKLSEAKDLVLKAKRELGIARGGVALLQAKSGK
jgi:hypothetical protein